MKWHNSVRDIIRSETILDLMVLADWEEESEITGVFWAFGRWAVKIKQFLLNTAISVDSFCREMFIRTSEGGMRLHLQRSSVHLISEIFLLREQMRHLL